MKPSAARVLERLRERPSTTAQLCQPEVGGVRFSSRVKELRDVGYIIHEERLPLPIRGSRYTLLAEPSTTSPVSPPPGDKPAPSIQAARAESSTPGVLGSSGNARAGSGTYLTRKDSGCGEPCPPVRTPDALFDPEPFTKRPGMEWSWA